MPSVLRTLEVPGRGQWPQCEPGRARFIRSCNRVRLPGLGESQTGIATEIPFVLETAVGKVS
jgi:hypothetical protein